MWISFLWAVWGSPAGRALILAGGGLLLLVLWTQWNREDAAREAVATLVQEQEHANVETVGKADRASYDWRECVVSGGVWAFDEARCHDPE